MKKFLALLLLPFTLCADLILLDTLDFDIDDSISFSRPNWNDSNDIFYYNVISFTVDTAGDWRAANTSILSNDSFDYTNYQQQFERNPWFNADTYIYLYNDSFDASNPTLNLIAQNDDGYNGGNDLQFDLTHTLETDTTYYSVVTTYDPEEKISGYIDIYGPNGASFIYTIIPEPTTYGLIMSGSLLILLLRKRHV
jgi:hypothetical protein